MGHLRNPNLQLQQESNMNSEVLIKIPINQ